MYTACTKHRTATTSASSSAGQFCRPHIEKGLACKTITVSEGLDGCGTVQSGLSCRRHSQPRLHSSQSHALFRIIFPVFDRERHTADRDESAVSPCSSGHFCGGVRSVPESESTCRYKQGLFNDPCQKVVL